MPAKLCRCAKRNSYFNGAGPAWPGRRISTSPPKCSPRALERCSGEPLGEIPIWKAWLDAAKVLLTDYEELTERDDYLIARYQDPSQPQPSIRDSFIVRDCSSFVEFAEDQRQPAPRELVAEVNSAYFRLEQHNTVEAWFKAAGWDLPRATVPKEEFEKRLADYRAEPATAPKITKSAVKDFVRDYFNSTSDPTMDDCESKWPHGSRRRKLLRVEYHAEAKNRGKPVKEGRRQKLAK